MITLLDRIVKSDYIESPQPWTRALARMIDIELILFLWVQLDIINYIEVVLRWNGLLSTENTNLIIFFTITLVYLGFVFCCFIYEVVLLTFFGATFGKMITGLKVINSNGHKPSLRESIKRTYNVFYEGLGLYIPIIVNLTLYKSFRMLNRYKITRWDEMNNTKLLHIKDNDFRVAIVWTIFLFYKNTDHISTLILNYI